MIRICEETDALLIVDLQNDFITGSLAVPGAEGILQKVKEYTEKFLCRFASRDWHPEDHSSFVENGGPWPAHCIAGTEGSELHSILDDHWFIQIYKGLDKNKEQYSAFDGTNIAELLKRFKIKRLFVCGLATDYCVKATVLDALKQFEGAVFLLADATTAVNVNQGDGVRAVMEMLKKGAIGITIEDIEE